MWSVPAAVCKAVNNHWTELLDWTTGLDYWTDQFYHKIHTWFENPCILIFVLELSLNRVLEVPPAPDTGCMMIIRLDYSRKSYKNLILLCWWICFSRGAH